MIIANRSILQISNVHSTNATIVIVLTRSVHTSITTLNRINMVRYEYTSLGFIVESRNSVNCFDSSYEGFKG